MPHPPSVYKFYNCLNTIRVTGGRNSLDRQVEMDVGCTSGNFFYYMYKIISEYLLELKPLRLEAVIASLVPTDKPLFKPEDCVAIHVDEFKDKSTMEIIEMIRNVFTMKEESIKNAYKLVL